MEQTEEEARAYHRAWVVWARTGVWPTPEQLAESKFHPHGRKEQTEEEARAYHKAWVTWARTGVWPKPERPVETKFNPWHDPENGQFTFAGAGNYFGGGEGAGGVSRSGVGGRGATAPAALRSDAVYRPQESGAGLDLTAGGSSRPTGRRGIGGNRGPALDPITDPMTLDQAFPGLSNSPAGVVIALGDNILDLTGPGRQVTADLNRAYSERLIEQIRAIQPNYRYDAIGTPTTAEGWNNQIDDLRFDRAVAFAREKGELGPMQVETLRAMQAAADKAYDEGMAMLRARKLTPRLSPAEALGNFIDRKVRIDLRFRFDRSNLNEARNPLIRVNRNEQESSADERTFRRPDARVGNVAFDVTLTRKTLATPQIRGFFNTDFKPDQVVIIRPRQIGPSSSYVITRPSSKTYLIYEVKMAMNGTTSGRLTGTKVYVPQSISEIYDFLSSLMAYAPTYEKMQYVLPNANLDLMFQILDESFLIVRKKVKEENYVKLVDLSARIKALFLEADDENHPKVMEGIRLIHEMEDIIQAARRRRVAAKEKDDEGEVTGD